MCDEATAYHDVLVTMSSEAVMKLFQNLLFDAWVVFVAY